MLVEDLVLKIGGWNLLGYVLAFAVFVWFVAKPLVDIAVELLNRLLDRMLRRAELGLQKYHDVLTRAVVHAQRHARFDESTQEWVIRVPCEPLKSKGFAQDLLEWEARYNEGLPERERLKRHAPAARNLRDLVDEMNREAEKRLYPSKR